MYNVINRAKNDHRLELKCDGGPKPKIDNRTERRIVCTKPLPSAVNVEQRLSFRYIIDDKPHFKFYQDNDPKHKSHKVRMWLLYNCGKVEDTPGQSLDLNPIERKVAKRQPKNMTALKDIPKNYGLKKLIQTMQNRLLFTINARGGHTKY